MTIRSINRLGLTICTVAPMLAISSCSTVSTGASMLLGAPVILPIAGIHALSQAEVRAEEARRKRERNRSWDRRKDGPFTWYWVDGKEITVKAAEGIYKYAEGTYKNKELDGLYSQWWPNGQKRREATYKDGKIDGLETTWYENGQKWAEQAYKDGILDGLGKTWHENGQKRKEVTYKDGILDGLWTQWDENGQKEVEATFKDGEEE